MNLRKILTLVFGSLHGEIRTVLLRDDIRAADAHATAALWTEGTLAMLADGGTGGGVLDPANGIEHRGSTRGHALDGAPDGETARNAAPDGEILVGDSTGMYLCDGPAHVLGEAHLLEACSRPAADSRQLRTSSQRSLCRRMSLHKQ